MAQTNLAYDLERFEQHTPVPEQKPQISVRRERSIHPLKIMAVAVLATAISLPDSSKIAAFVAVPPLSKPR